MIQELLELKSKVDRIIRESFQNQSKFHDVVRVGGRYHGNGNGSTRLFHANTHIATCVCVCVCV